MTGAGQISGEAGGPEGTDISGGCSSSVSRLKVSMICTNIY